MTLYLAASPDAGGLFNLGSGEAHTWLELAQAIFAALRREPQIAFIEMPETLRGMYQYYTKADITKLRQSGFEATPSQLAEAVRDYVQNYLEPAIHLGDEAMAARENTP